MIGANREIMKNYDMISIIMIYVGDPGKENYIGIIKLLGVLLSAKLSAEEKNRCCKTNLTFP